MSANGTLVEGLPSTNYWTFELGGLISATAASSAVQVDDTSLTSFSQDQAPTFTSADSTTFIASTPGSFAISTSAVPVATYSESGSLPSGVTFSTAGVLTGIPAPGTSGIYPITITASNGVSPDATQSFTLTVDEQPSINSSDQTALTVGTRGPSL